MSKPPQPGKPPARDRGLENWSCSGQLNFIDHEGRPLDVEHIDGSVRVADACTTCRQYLLKDGTCWLCDYQKPQTKEET